MDGDVDLKIPSGVQPGTTLVMGKRGVPRLGGSGRGDHMVSICHLPLCSGAWQPGWLAHACGHCSLRFSLEVSGLQSHAEQLWHGGDGACWQQQRLLC